MIVVLVISGLLGFYLYKIIERIDTLEHVVSNSIIENFQNTIEIPYELVEPKIQQYLTELRAETEAK